MVKGTNMANMKGRGSHEGEQDIHLVVDSCPTLKMFANIGQLLVSSKLWPENPQFYSYRKIRRGGRGREGRLENFSDMQWLRKEFLHTSKITSHVLVIGMRWGFKIPIPLWITTLQLTRPGILTAKVRCVWIWCYDVHVICFFRLFSIAVLRH